MKIVRENTLALVNHARTPKIQVQGKCFLHRSSISHFSSSQNLEMLQTVLQTLVNSSRYVSTLTCSHTHENNWCLVASERLHTRTAMHAVQPLWIYHFGNEKETGPSFFLQRLLELLQGMHGTQLERVNQLPSSVPNCYKYMYSSHRNQPAGLEFCRIDKDRELWQKYTK